MIHDRLPYSLLEIERSLFHFGVEFAVDEDARVEVLLRGFAEFFVFGHDAFVDVVDELEVGFGRVFVAEDFVAHGGGCGGVRDEALDHEEVGSSEACQLM